MAQILPPLSIIDMLAYHILFGKSYFAVFVSSCLLLGKQTDSHHIVRPVFIRDATLRGRVALELRRDMNIKLTCALRAHWMLP